MLFVLSVSVTHYARFFLFNNSIFGNTGSGKSYTLAKLYHEIIKKFKDQKKFQKNARFLIIDFNGEYVAPVACIICTKVSHLF